MFTLSTPSMTTNPNDRRRREWQRDIARAINASALDPKVLREVDRLLRKMDKWLAAPDLNDPRVDWETWSLGAKRSLQQGSTRADNFQKMPPLQGLLEHDHVPLDMKRHALAIARQLEAVCPDWLDHAPEHRYYGNLPLTTWLRCADLPEAVAFFQERQDPTWWAQHVADRRVDGGMPTQEQWGHAFARILSNPVTHTLRSNNHHRISGARLNVLLDRAIANGWVRSDFLSTYAWLKSPELSALVPANLNPLQSGTLPEMLATFESPGGLFERWCRERADWSTWVSPSTGATVWRSVLLNPNPHLLLNALHADPSALDRPVPIGRWIRGKTNPGYATVQRINNQVTDMADLPGIAPESVRYYAGATLSTGVLDKAVQAHPHNAPRLLAWWNDQAPTLRETLTLVATQLLPIEGPVSREMRTTERWALQVSSMLEGLMLRETLDVTACVTTAPAISTPKPRSRL